MMKMEYFKDSYLNPDEELKILDVGSFDKTGHYNYGMVLNEKNWTYTGLDLKEGNNVDVVIENPYEWSEIEENAYDVVVTGQALEHIEFFWLTMGEIERVLRPGGYVCIIAPSAGPRHGGNMPNCYRFYEDGLRAMAKYVDLEVLHASVDNREEANPWNDACLVAHKSGSYSNEDTQQLEARINNLEGKLDTILEAIKQK